MIFLYNRNLYQTTSSQDSLHAG